MANLNGKGRAHERVGQSGRHPMEVPGLDNRQGGNRNPNRAGRVTPPSGTMPGGEEAATNPRQAPDLAAGNGGATPNAAPGTPPSGASPAAPGQERPGPFPNNPQSTTLARPRMY